jgi:hypothetical protein
VRELEEAKRLYDGKLATQVCVGWLFAVVPTHRAQNKRSLMTSQSPQQLLAMLQQQTRSLDAQTGRTD